MKIMPYYAPDRVLSQSLRMCDRVVPCRMVFGGVARRRAENCDTSIAIHQ